MQNGNVLDFCLFYFFLSSRHTYHFFAIFFAQKISQQQYMEGRGRGENKQKRGILLQVPRTILIFKVCYSLQLQYTLLLQQLQYCTACSLSSCCCCCFQPSSASFNTACACVYSFSIVSFRVLRRALSLSPIFAASEVSLHILLRTQHTHRPRLSLTSGFKPVKYYYQCEIKVFFT